jgi:transposase-like protein
MDTHNNARLTPRGREEMVRAVVDRGLSKAEAARQFNTTWKTVDKWIRRFRRAGSDGLRDRSSRPHSSPSQTPLATADAIEALRRDRHTQSHVAAKLGLSTATVSRISGRPCVWCVMLPPEPFSSILVLPGPCFSPESARGRSMMGSGAVLGRPG